MGFHFVAVVFYLSAAVDLAYITFVRGLTNLSIPEILKVYRLDIAAVVRQTHIHPDPVTILYNNILIYCNSMRTTLQPCCFQVMCYVATLLYFLHAIFSAIRWKRA